MANIFDVSKYILTSIGDKISTMKLQKLCYYAQAWNLAWGKGELFPEDFYKWDNGPVCPRLFRVHQGEFYISKEGIPSSYLSKQPLTDTEKETVDQIIEDYGIYTGAQLSFLTHQEAPWKDTQKNNVISKDSMKNYYAAL